MKKIIFLIFLLLVFINVLNAQNLSFKPFLNRNPFTFLNNNKLTMHHSFSFTAISNSRQTYFQNDYTNIINYNISSNLSLQMNLHFINYGDVNFNNGYSDLRINNSKKINFIPEFKLSFKPSDKINIIFSYSNRLKEYRNFNSDFYYFQKRN